MGIFFPSLSDQGWVKSNREIADFALSHFFESNYSQSQLYNGSVSSLAYIIQENNGDVNSTASDIETKLTSYLLSMLPGVVVSCVPNTADTTTSESSVSLYISFNDSTGKKVTMSNLLEIKNSKLYKVTNLNNNGV